MTSTRMIVAGYVGAFAIALTLSALGALDFITNIWDWLLP